MGIDPVHPDLTTVISVLSTEKNLAGAAIIDPDGSVLIRFQGPDPDFLPGDLDSSVLRTSDIDWFISSGPDSSWFAAVALWNSGLTESRSFLFFGLGGILLGLLFLAFITPRFIQKKLLDPLRELLHEADMVVEGGGKTTDSAKASLHQLVDMLAVRDRELNELRKTAEHRADLAEARAGTILGTMKSGLLAVGNNRDLLYFNHKASEILELTEEDMGNRYPVDRNEASRLLWDRVLAPASEFEEKIPDDCEFEIPGSNGVRVLNMTMTKPFENQIAVLLTDITRIRQLERSLANEAAMSRLGFMASGISHEMGNTLCALAGFVDLVTKGNLEPRTEKILQEAKIEIESAQKMIQAFRAYAKPQKVELQSVTVAEITKNIKSICRKTGSNYIADSLLESSAVIKADMTVLQTCVENIIRNAKEADRKAIPEVDLEISDNIKLNITISDSGPGLPENPDVLFQPFFSTGQDGTNMGIGLAVTRRLITAMNGTIRAENRKGEAGASFILTFPLERSE